MYQMVELAGYTYRLWEMLEVFDDMEREQYRTATEGRMQSIDSSLPKQELRKIPPLAVLVETEDYIELKNISIITPNSDFIVSDLSFKVCNYLRFFLFFTPIQIIHLLSGGERNASAHYRS